jgi:hypothetical protein
LKFAGRNIADLTTASMTAGASATGKAFAIRNCNALFSTISRGFSLEETAGHVSGVRAMAPQAGREIGDGLRTIGAITGCTEFLWDDGGGTI